MFHNWKTIFKDGYENLIVVSFRLKIEYYKENTKVRMLWAKELENTWTNIIRERICSKTNMKKYKS